MENNEVTKLLVLNKNLQYQHVKTKIGTYIANKYKIPDILLTLETVNQRFLLFLESFLFDAIIQNNSISFLKKCIKSPLPSV